MMRQVKGLLYFITTDFRYSITIFWSILTAILAVSLVVSYLLLNVEEAKFGFGFPFATYVQAGILGFISVKEAIPFSLKMGAVRKNIYVAIGIFFIGFAMFQALLSSILQSLVQAFADATNLHPFMFLHPAQLLENNSLLTRFYIDTVIIFLMLTVFFVIGLLFYRGGLVVGGSVLGIAGILFLLSLALGWITDFLLELYYTIDLMFFAQIFLIALVLYGISYFLMRKITTVKVS